MEDTYPRNGGIKSMVLIHIPFLSELSGKEGQKEGIMSFPGLSVFSLV